LRITAFSRPHPFETENGDGWLSVPHRDGERIIVIDGAGHGPAAAMVTASLANICRSGHGGDLAELFRFCHEAVRGSRGAVMSIAEVVGDRLTFAGVGNVDGLFVDTSGSRRLLPDRGMLGAALPAARPFTVELSEPWAFVMHTDGVSDKFEIDLTIEQIISDPEAFVRSTVEGWGRQSDDATILVIQG
jgi:phosphoserine phosphatase RsbX